MQDQVVTDLSGGDQDHQQRQEQGVSVHLPVEEQKDPRKEHAGQREIYGHIKKCDSRYTWHKSESQDPSGRLPLSNLAPFKAVCATPVNPDVLLPNQSKWMIL